jgi:predicted adenylyl cyclase CyaB
MKRNVEIKARVVDHESIANRAREVADRDPVTLEQEDQFFHSPRGRLKLRRLSASEGELIFYDRADSAEPVESRYSVCRTHDPDGLRAVLTDALGATGVVRKVRTIYETGRARVHLDEVEGLGKFVEIELELRPDQDAASGGRTVEELMSYLGISRRGLLRRAYIDFVREGDG